MADSNAFANAHFNPVPYQPCFDYNDDGIVTLPHLGVFVHDFTNSLPSAYCTSGR